MFSDAGLRIRRSWPLAACLLWAIAPQATADETRDRRELGNTQSGIRANSAVSAETTTDSSAVAKPPESSASDRPAKTSSPVLNRGASPRIERGRSRGNLGGGSGGAVDLLWPLGLVLVVVGLLAWGVKRWMPASMRNVVAGGGVLRVIARQSISSKQSICLVRAGRRLVLLGVTPERISALSEITDGAEAAALISAVEGGREGSFSSLMTSAIDAGTENEIEEQEERSAHQPSDSLVPSRDLAHARERVRSLLGRVRAMTEVETASAEPARRAVAPR